MLIAPFIWIWEFITGRRTHRHWLLERERSQQDPPSSTPIDITLLITIMALLSIGLVMVYSSSIVRSGISRGDPEHFFHQQLVFMVIGFVVMWVVSRIPYVIWGNASTVLCGLSVLSLIIVLTPLGKSVNGAQRWIQLGVNIQPVELMKFTWILFLCHYYSDPKVNMGSMKNLIIPGLTAVVIILLLAGQPDFGSAIIIAFLFSVSFFLAGGAFYHLIVSILVPMGLFGLAMSHRFTHIIKRLNSFTSQFQEGAGPDYNLQQALISFGSGRWTGVGVGKSSQKGFFLPEAHTDFIFDIYGEEFGFLGVLVLVGLYFLFFLRGLYIARNATTTFGSHLAALISILFVIQALINMAMAIGLLPTKGLTLPLISYGGSSLIVICIGLGVLLNISRRSKHSPFEIKLISLSQSLLRARVDRSIKSPSKYQVAQTQLHQRAVKSKSS
jgi:cell division protein FtsW